MLAATADGASANRRLMKIHKTKSKHGEVVYKVTNPYAAEKRQLYFFSDPPHLIIFCFLFCFVLFCCFFLLAVVLLHTIFGVQECI